MMKNVICLLVVSLLLQSFQCEENETTSTITPQQLAVKKQEILNYIQSFSCVDASGCNYIAFGAKPCGGPREYLVFPNGVNQTTLENMVDEYYEMDHQYNIQTGALSDCMIVSPPNTIDCVSGDCIIID